MPATRFESELLHETDRVVIDLRGEIDGAARDELAAVYEAAAAEGASSLLLNFSGVQYINSTGIALIVGMLGRARADGRTLAACGLSEHYRELFQITRLSDFIPIYPDEATSPSGKETV
jgi:anti-sigma B factor antagonist